MAELDLDIILEWDVKAKCARREDEAAALEETQELPAETEVT